MDKRKKIEEKRIILLSMKARKKKSKAEQNERIQMEHENLDIKSAVI